MRCLSIGLLTLLFRVANWLVCFAVFISISSREISSKIVIIWWPTFTFVALGLDHVIANMYSIPIAIFYGHPSIGVGLYIWKSLIPTTLGNIIGAVFFVASAYWYLCLTGVGPHGITFNPSGNRKDEILEGQMPVGSPNSISSVLPTGMKMASGLVMN